MTQTATILELLRSTPEGISALDALRAGAGMRLAARIADLRAAGFDIESVRVEGQPFVRYVIHTKAEQAALPW